MLKDAFATVLGLTAYAAPKRGPNPLYQPLESDRAPLLPCPSPAKTSAPGRPPAIGLDAPGSKPLAAPFGSNGAEFHSQRRPYESVRLVVARHSSCTNAP